MKKMKKLFAFILAMVMAVSVLPAAGQTAEAAGTDTIELHGPIWGNNCETYQFSNVEVNFSAGGQKIFCLSVDNGGTFVVPQTVKLGGSETEIKGVQKVGGKLEYVSSVTGGMELSSLTVIGKDITETEIEAFIKALVFHRNGVARKAKQKVSVVSNKVDLSGKDMTVMAVDGVIHYYRYVLYDENDHTSTWYAAYNAAKNNKFQEMKGYLATVTNENEQLYLYGDLNEDEVNRRSVNLRAWIGGARTLNAENFFDVDSITEAAFNPGTKNGSPFADTWNWMCGPEAGTPFYKTDSNGTKYGPGEVDGAYNGWNDNGEPNNQYSTFYESNPHNDTYQQEYVLEYGYDAANWNDYSPYNVLRNNQYGIEGYIIEFSPYTIKGSDGSVKENITEPVPSAVDMKVIVVDGIEMTANDFILSTTEAQNLTADQAKAAGKVTVTDQSVEVIDNNLVQVNQNQLNTIKNGGKGEYDLNYTYDNTTSGESASQSVTVTVVDVTAEGKANDGSNADIEIGANHFSITLEQAKAIKDDLSKQTGLIKALANAVATENGNTVDPKNITIKSCGIEPKRGKDYPVVFDYKGVEVTVYVEVLDNGSEETTVNLTANDFTVTAGAGNQLIPDSFIEKSSATAAASDGSKVNVVPDSADLQKLNQAIQNEQLGEYKVKVTGTTGNGASASTVVTVKVVQYPYIDAHDFIISVTDAKNADENEIKDASDAVRLKNEDDTDNESGKITVPDVDVSKLNAVEEPGTVSDITLHDTSDNSAGDRKVSATVVDRTKEGVTANGSDQPAHVVVGANNFNLTVKQAQQIVNDPTSNATQDIIKMLANAVGTNNGKAVDSKWIIGNPAEIRAENGVYDVTFTYWGQTVTVKATVKDEGSADGSTPAGKIPDINLTANDFSIPAKSTVLDTTPEKTFKDMADVVAKLNDGSSVTDVTPDSSQLTALANAVKEGKKGEYPVTVTANKDGKTVTATVTVTVTDEGADTGTAGIPSKPGDEHIGANNFIIGTDDFPLLTPENVLKLSNVEAYDIDTKKDVPVTKVDTSKVENKPGKYPITLSTDKGTTTTVYVTIDESWKTIGDVDKASEANKDKTSVEQDKAVKAGDKPADTKGDDKTFELSNPKDVTQKLDTGRVVNNVSLAGAVLPAGDYTVSGTTLTIKSTALAGKPEGTYPVVVNYNDGSKRTFNVVVVNKEVVDESHMSGDELDKRDDLPLLLAKGIGGDKQIKLTWLKYKGAEGYEIYWSYCNGKKVYKKVTATKATVRKATHKKLSYKKSYKYFVIAYKMVDGKKVYIAKSPQIHVAMKKDKKTNAKKVTVKKSKVTLKPGKTSVIKASMSKEDPKKKLLQHAVKFRYYTDDYRVATVNKKGKIKAVAAGKCNIYVIANNGVYKKIKVTVKK